MKRFASPLRLFCLIVFWVFGLGACSSFDEPKLKTAEDIVDRATETVNRLRALPKLETFRNNIQKARAVAVFPRLIKAGFGAGAEGGNGLISRRGADGRFGPPAFYTLAAGSFGFQIGVQDTEVVMLVMNDRALESLVEHQGKLGADAGVTVGLAGAGLEGSTTTNLGVDVIAYANAVIGVYAGVTLEGAALVRRGDLNAAFYNTLLSPMEILNGGVRQPIAAPLRRALDARRAGAS